MKNSLLIILLVLISLFSTKSHAGWYTIQTKIDRITTYVDRDYILITPENLTFEIPQPCNTHVIAIDPSVDSQLKDRTLSSLLSAQARGATVKLTVNDNSCVPWTSGNVQYLKLIKVTIE